MYIAMSELLFECFSASSVAYGVDALFSHHYNCVAPANDGIQYILSDVIMTSLLQWAWLRIVW